MNISAVLKKSAQLCVGTLMMSILLLPVQAAENVPVPKTKPEHASNGTPLSANQASLYSNIFKAQALSDISKADDLLAKIKDKRLLGHVLYQRYMNGSYAPSFEELQSWMASYADHSGAGEIYKLALSKQSPDNSNKITKPRNGRMLSQINEPTIYYPKNYRPSMARNNTQEKSVKALSRKIRSLIRSGKSVEALEYFYNSASRELMDTVERDIINSKIAAGLLYSMNFNAAYELAASSSDRSGNYVPEASWVTGLALWQQGKFASAANYFGKIAPSPYASGWLSSAGSYWAARSYKRIGNKDEMVAALKDAARHSRTFYGLMAAQSLKQDFGFDWEMPSYNISHEKIILKERAGKRIFSLVAAGQYDLAQNELMRLNYKGNAKLRRAVLAYASHVGLPAIALRLGNMVRNPNGGYYDSALYPLSPWSPEGGYKIDPALVHAVMRQESRFNMQATSNSGAVGLMQIMPKTASYVAKNNNYAGGISSAKLRFPEVNLKIGQDYLEYLLKSRVVKGDVVSMLIAYNAGPGNLLKWRKRMGDSADILLFIEMMPVKETRDYVEHVLSNYWIYRHRAGLDLPSLAALSSGKLPKYAHIMQASHPYKLAAAN